MSFALLRMDLDLAPLVAEHGNKLYWLVETYLQALKHVDLEEGKAIKSKLDRVLYAPPVLAFTARCPFCTQEVTLHAPDYLKQFLQDTHTACPACAQTLTCPPQVVQTALYTLYDTYIREAFISKDEPSIIDIFKLYVITRKMQRVAPVCFGHMRTDRIGHQALNTWLHICKMHFDITPKRKIYYYAKGFVANTALHTLWSRHIDVHDKLSVIAELFPKGKEHFYLEEVFDGYNCFERHPLRFPFSQAENQHAQAELARMGVPPHAPFVCLHVRDTAYLKVILPTLDATYHDYRNSDIDTYQAACEFLAAKGLYVLRMGVAVNKPLTWASDMIIDYAHRFRSEFMDVWLWQHCKLAISTLSGIDALSMCMSSPLLLVNVLPVSLAFCMHNITSFPKSLLNKDGKHVPLLHALCDYKFYRTEEYIAHNISMQNMSATELRDAVAEKLDRMAGVSYTPEEARLQSRFKQMLTDHRHRITHTYHDETGTRSTTPIHPPVLNGAISTAFLRQYADELLAYESPTQG